MFVGEDRAPQVGLAARRVQVAPRRADRVDRVVWILLAVAVGVHSVRLPGRGKELHPADRSRGGDVEVGAEGGLDPVDPGQHLPGDPVLGSAGLIDGEQEGRDRELVDEEAGNAEWSGRGIGDREGRVGLGRHAIGLTGGLLAAGRAPSAGAGRGAAAAVRAAAAGSVPARSAGTAPSGAATAAGVAARATAGTAARATAGTAA